MSDRERILNGLRDSVVNYERDKAVDLANEAISLGIDAKDAITLGLTAGMSIIGEMYEAKEVYLPEVMAASQAMNFALDILTPHLKAEADGGSDQKVVICTIEGDVHSIGKSIVATLLNVHGYSVNDLGADVPLTSIVEAAESDGADLIAMSTLMTSTMPGMEEVIKMLRSKGIRENYKVAVGGAPVNEDFMRHIGADVTAANAETAVKLIGKMFGGD